MTPLTPAGQALVAKPCNCGFIPSYDPYHAPACDSRLGVPAAEIEEVERQAADRALAELRREVEADGLDAGDHLRSVLALIDKASTPEEGA